MRQLAAWCRRRTRCSSTTASRTPGSSRKSRSRVSRLELVNYKIFNYIKLLLSGGHWVDCILPKMEQGGGASCGRVGGQDEGDCDSGPICQFLFSAGGGRPLGTRNSHDKLTFRSSLWWSLIIRLLVHNAPSICTYVHMQAGYTSHQTVSAMCLCRQFFFRRPPWQRKKICYVQWNVDLFGFGKGIKWFAI